MEVGISNRGVCVVRELLLYRKLGMVRAITMSADTLRTDHTIISLRLTLTAGLALTVGCELTSTIHRSSAPRSLAVCQRSSGSFVRHLPTTRSSRAGATGMSDDMSGGLSLRMAP